MGRHDDLDGDQVADQGRVIDPTLYDRQSQAFREHDGSLHVPDDELGQHVALVHAPLGSGGDPLVLPEAYDADGWDEGRVGPKGLDEARVALAERIADPQAPDGDEVRGVYDEPEAPSNPPGPCADCGRPFSPDHDADAPGPNVRHPFRASHPFGGDS